MTRSPAVWAGVECSHLRVGEVVRDQLRETGHAHRDRDLDLIAALEVQAVRYPVLWGWGETAAETDWEWADRRLARLRSLGIAPIVGLLHHGFGPADPLADDYPERFADYAASVATRYPWVRMWLPVNEPLTTARFAGLYGWWWPHRHDHPSFIRLLLNECLAQVLASRAIRAVIPEARILVTEDAGATTGTPEMAANVEHEGRRRWLTFDLLTGRVGPDHPLWTYLSSASGARASLERLRSEPEPPDVLGLDYYVTSDRYLDHRVERYPMDLHGGDGRRRYVDVESARVPDGGFQGFRGVLAATWERYGLPVALTEVCLAGEAADQIAWWCEAWEGALAVSQAGGVVEGVGAWAVFGACGWANMLREPGSAVEPGCLLGSDVSDGRPTLRSIIRETARTGRVPDVEAGWWRRDGRHLLPEMRVQRRSGSRPPASRGLRHTDESRPRIPAGAGATAARSGSS